MKLKHTITAAVLTLASLVLTQGSALAQSGSVGDLILSFRDSNGKKTGDLEVDLGSAANFTTSASLNLTFGSSYYGGANAGGLSTADLNSVFGTTGNGWNALSTAGTTTANLVFDLAGQSGLTTPAKAVVFITQTLGNATGAPGASLSGPAGAIQTMTTGLTFGGLTSPTAANVLGSSGSSYTTELGGGGGNPDFGFFNSSESGVSSSANQTLELFQYTGTNIAGNHVTDLGTITLTPTGNLTFQGVAAVPEPATLGLLGFAAVGMVGLRRRRAIIA